MRGAVMCGAGDIRVDERGGPTGRVPLAATTLPAVVRAALEPDVMAPARTSRVREAVRS
ncbi:hypothetical protein ABZ614_46010 [Streptomyces sp. NPDC013178]|uniref:hypothetical protein n=1 Tax=unclassified Streptomyces TaxID=2593676 RepID=UPI0033F89F31